MADEEARMMRVEPEKLTQSWHFFSQLLLKRNLDYFSYANGLYSDRSSTRFEKFTRQYRSSNRIYH